MSVSRVWKWRSGSKCRRHTFTILAPPRDNEHDRLLLTRVACITSSFTSTAATFQITARPVRLARSSSLLATADERQNETRLQDRRTTTFRQVIPRKAHTMYTGAGGDGISPRRDHQPRSQPAPYPLNFDKQIDIRCPRAASLH